MGLPLTPYGGHMDRVAHGWRPLGFRARPCELTTGAHATQVQLVHVAQVYYSDDARHRDMHRGNHLEYGRHMAQIEATWG